MDAHERCVTTDLFVSGKGGYHTYRIPSLAVSADGTVLALCEGRRVSARDDGDIDLLLCRSSDGGRTWSKPRIIAEGKGQTMGNPCPVVDARSSVVVLLWCHNNQRILLARSTDDGRTWSQPTDITPQLATAPLPWVGVGPGHGIQLRGGRLLIPCWADHTERLGEVQYSFAIYSDDGGATWRCGKPMDRDASDECEAVELLDGSLYMTLRSRGGRKRRGWARSADGGDTWTSVIYDATLPEPECQGSIIRLSGAPSPWVVFACPANPAARDHLTLHMSYDECQTWPVSRVLYGGPAAYSDLAAVDGEFLCFFEADDYRRLVLARVGLSWLESGE